MAFKASADRRHHIPRQRHRVTNSAAYDAALRQRGSLTVWFTDAAIAAVTTAIDKSPADARLWAVTPGGDLPTAATPRPGARPPADRLLRHEAFLEGR